MTRTYSKIVRAKSILKVLAIEPGIDLDCEVCRSLGWREVRVHLSGHTCQNIGYVVEPDVLQIGQSLDGIYWLDYGSSYHKSPSRFWDDIAGLMVNFGVTKKHMHEFRIRFGKEESPAIAACRVFILVRRGHWP